MGRLILLCLLFVGCSVKNVKQIPDLDNSIPYILPSSVEEVMDQYLKSHESATSVKSRLDDNAVDFPIRRNTIYHTYYQSFCVKFTKDGILNSNGSE